MSLSVYPLTMMTKVKYLLLIFCAFIRDLFKDKFGLYMTSVLSSLRKGPTLSLSLEDSTVIISKGQRTFTTFWKCLNSQVSALPG